MRKLRIPLILVPAVLLVFFAAVPDGDHETGSGRATTAVTIDGWVVVGAQHVRSFSKVIDGGDAGMPMPSSPDDDWIAFSSDGSVAATPPDNPGGPTLRSDGVVALQRAFWMDMDHTHLRVSAVFLPNEPATGRRDFLSVDVSDGLVVHNLIYLDVASPRIGQRSVHRNLPATAPTTVDVDLRQLFPDADSQTAITVTLAMGNGADGEGRSWGYFDDLSYGLGVLPVTFAAPVVGFDQNPGGYWELQCRAPQFPGEDVVNVFSLDTRAPAGTGPFYGLVPDALTMLTTEAAPGHVPFRATLDGDGLWSTPLPPIAPGITVDVLMFVVAPGAVLAQSRLKRHTF